MSKPRSRSHWENKPLGLASAFMLEKRRIVRLEGWIPAQTTEAEIPCREVWPVGYGSSCRHVILSTETRRRIYGVCPDCMAPTVPIILGIHV